MKGKKKNLCLSCVQWGREKETKTTKKRKEEEREKCSYKKKINREFRKSTGGKRSAKGQGWWGRSSADLKRGGWKANRRPRGTGWVHGRRGWLILRST